MSEPAPRTAILTFAPTNWTPLERLFSPERCRHFMGMGQAIQDGVTLHLYKHRDTRHYLNLDCDGRAYQFDHTREPAYTVIPLGDAIAHAFS